MDDYVLLCEENSRQIQKTYRRSFNIRLSPELHRKAVHTSLKWISLNQLVHGADDNRIIECAVEANADYLVTGDAHLLDLRRYKHIEIVNPTDYPAILTESRQL